MKETLREFKEKQYKFVRDNNLKSEIIFERFAKIEKN